MKRSPLIRRTPLKKVSKKRRDWNALYREAHEHDEPYQHCAHCGIYQHKHFLDRHHPHGRAGKWILEYVYLCGSFLVAANKSGCRKHVTIHDNGKQARKDGWLTEVYDGKPFDGSKTRPWKYLPNKRGTKIDIPPTP